MNLRSTLIVFSKEMKDILRDRRTVMSMILFPILVIPLLTVGMMSLMESRMERIREKVAAVAWIAPQDQIELHSRLAGDPGIDLMTGINDSATIIGLLKAREIDAVVIVPPTFGSDLGALLDGVGDSPVPRIGLYIDETRQKSRFAAGRVSAVIEQFRSELVAGELEGRGLPAELVSPFEVVRENVATPEEMGRFLAATFLPYLIIIMALTGGMYPAIDLTAGEKERGTLETLLVSGVSRLDIVLGKFLTVFVASMVTATLAVGSLAATGAGIIGISRGLASQLNFSIEPGSIVLLVAAMIPLAAIFSALLMTLALFAKSYREAQSYTSPLIVIVILPAMMSLMPDTELSREMALVPVMNASMMMKDALTGAVDPVSVVVTMGVNIVLAALCLLLVLRMFQRESVLFRI